MAVRDDTYHDVNGTVVDAALGVLVDRNLVVVVAVAILDRREVGRQLSCRVHKVWDVALGPRPGHKINDGPEYVDQTGCMRTVKGTYFLLTL